MTWPIKNFQLLFVQAAVNQEPETGVEKPEVEAGAEKPEEVNKILTLIDMFSHVTLDWVAQGVLRLLCDQSGFSDFLSPQKSFQ